MLIYLKKYLISRFNIKSINKKYVFIILSSIILGFISFIINKESIFYEGTKIKRSTFGSLDNIYNLNLDIGKEIKNKNTDILVSAKRYKEEEAKVFFEYGIDKVLDTLKGANHDYEHILYDFNFTSYIYDGIEVIYNFKLDEKIPFSEAVNYYSLVEDNGKINNHLIEEDSYVCGKIEYYFRAYVDGKERKINSDKYDIDVKIWGKPLTNEEKLIKKFNNMVSDNNDQTISEDYIELPQYIDSVAIKYKEKADLSFLVIIGLGIAIVFILKYKEKYDDIEKEKKKKEELFRLYPSFVTKVLLYIETGMTVRNTLCRVARDYRRNDEKNILSNKLIELKIKLENGALESDAYLAIAKALDDKLYSRFFNLILQNIKNGTKELSNILRMEASDALQEKKNNARKLGEEASTKLILPLLLELMIVMLVIIVPAFMGI